MALGLVLGRDVPSASVDPCYEAVRIFLERFTSQYHALTCLELTGVHLGTPEGQAAFREQGQLRHCTDYVSVATGIVMQIIQSKAG
jgi:hypothetical protein